MRKSSLATSVALIALSPTNPAFAASDTDIQALRQEIQAMKGAYENRISELESKLLDMETKQSAPSKTQTSAVNADSSSGRQVFNNDFNPSIGVILNGQYRNFSSDEGDIAGFAIGEEGERHGEGLAVDHTELNFSANIDDKFAGSVTIAVAEHEGATEIELEEAFVQTLPGIGLPDGMGIKAGRALWTIGYLNEHHSHADDFTDRPLPYRAFLNGAYNDDGVEVSYVLPTDLYFEIGGGVFRGDDFPFGEAEGGGIGAWSAYTRVGGDIGYNQSWRVGTSVLSGEAKGGRMSNEDTVSFTGDTDLYIADVRYTWAPTGNAREQELILQGEYFWRSEDGVYEDTDAETGAVTLDDNSSGWYAQGVYKFHPQWRIGARYSLLDAADTPAGLVGSALDSDGHDPKAYTVMLDWTNSEFSRVRLQFNREELAGSQGDNQVTVQYIMSLGAHGAHKY